MKEGLLTWGYVLDTVPGQVPFVNGASHCSLETAAEYLDAEGVVFMNSNHDINSLDAKRLARIPETRNIICGLQHTKYVETAVEVGRLSLVHKNIRGAIIDDFLEWHGPSAKMTPEELKAVREALRKENPSLKLYVVRYTWQDQKDLLPYLEYFDAINLWVWISTDHYWRAEYEPELDRIKQLTGKPITQGIFIHNYGETWNNRDGDRPVDLELIQLQCRKIFPKVRNSTLEGCIVLQNGWFDHDDHREHVQWMKNYIDWFYGTTTERN